MSDRVLLDQPYSLDGVLRIATTKRCFNDLRKAEMDPEETLRVLSGMDMLLFWVQPRGSENSYMLYTRSGIYMVAQSDEGDLLLTSYRTATLRDNNTCLKSGISVKPSCGVVMSINIVVDSDNRCFRLFENGRAVDNANPARTANDDLFPLLDRVSEESRQSRKPRGTNEPYRLPENAERMISIAEGYTRTDADLERARTQQIPPMVYWGFHPAEAYDRQDRVAYTAFVEPYDEAQYALNGKVQLETKDGALQGATIIGLGEQEGNKTVTLLFDEQLSFSALPGSGQIRPSYSDIQNEVRQDVIDDLRKGKSEAVFLADVLGSFQTSGFTQKDLHALDAALAAKKYPPNASQVDAIHRGIEANDILLVLGPPGTGKTTVILEWVKYFIKQEGKRVLISSQNNKAVDNVLERLTQEKGISSIRAGNEAKVQANMHPYLLENKLKQLREDVEASVTGNQAELQGLDAQYRARFQAGQEAQNLMTQQKQAWAQLVGTADARYSGFATTLLTRQQERRKLTATLNALLQRIRRYEFFMVDPQMHPLLRWLFTPVRLLLRRPLRETVERYASVYAQYQANLADSRRTHAQLCTMVQDDELLGYAQRFRTLCEEVAQYLAPLRQPVDDRRIWPDRAWPQLSDPCTEQDVTVYLQALRARYARLTGLAAACAEWSEHVQSQSNYALSDLLLESADLVGSTCIGINSQRKFSRLNFDVTIIDEAGQIQIHNALVPISRSPKLIMLGDHLQIPPMVDDEQAALCEEQDIDTTFLGTSLFEYLYENLPPENRAFLDTQYRMPAQIADLLGEWFYEGKYKSFSGKRNLPAVCPALFGSPFVVISTSDAGPARLEYKPEMGAGNHYEADLIVSIVRTLLQGKFGDAMSPSDFGIISPYGEQVQNIRKKLREALPELSVIEIRDMVASLDSFQGQERSLILYSCTRSNRRPADRSRIGFLKELRRLNVALSRPLKQLVFVGDIDFLSSCTNGEGRGSESEFSAFIRLMCRHAAEQGEFVLSKEFAKRLETE